PVDAARDEARLDPLPSDPLDARTDVGGDGRVVVAPAGEEGRVVRVGDADPGGALGVVDVAGEGGRGAPGARGGDDPRRFGVPLLRQLLEDRLGDVVVATPVCPAFGVCELIHVVTAVPPRQRWGDVVDLAGLVDEMTLPSMQFDQL